MAEPGDVTRSSLTAANTTPVSPGQCRYFLLAIDTTCTDFYGKCEYKQVGVEMAKYFG